MSEISSLGKNSNVLTKMIESEEISQELKMLAEKCEKQIFKNFLFEDNDSINGQENHENEEKDQQPIEFGEEIKDSRCPDDDLNLNEVTLLILLRTNKIRNRG